MGLRNVVIRPIESALEQAKERFDCVGMSDQPIDHAALTCVFALAVVYGLMRLKVLAHEFVLMRAVSHEVRVFRDLRSQDVFKVACGNVCDVV